MRISRLIKNQKQKNKILLPISALASKILSKIPVSKKPLSKKFLPSLIIGLFVFILIVVGLMFKEDALARFGTATSPDCTTAGCHTAYPSALTVGAYSSLNVGKTDINPATQISNPITLLAGSTLDFYVKVSGEPITSSGSRRNRIGAGIMYPPSATPRGSNGAQQDPNTWTVYTPSGMLLANNAIFAWNANNTGSGNINLTKVYGTTSTDVSDNDRNGFELFPARLQIPVSAKPGAYTIDVFGAGTGGYAGKMPGGLVLNVLDSTRPIQISNLSVKYLPPNVKDPTNSDKMNINWNIPNPPDNSGAITKLYLYRYGQPITDTNLGMATLITTKTAPNADLVGGVKNIYLDDMSGYPTGTTFYYSVVTEDADGNKSLLSTGPIMGATKQLANFPTVTMFRPNDHTTVTGKILLESRATDTAGISSMTFQYSTTVDFAAPVDIAGSASIVKGTAKNGYWGLNWDSSSLGINGDYYIRAKASNGNVSYSDIIEVTIDDVPPSSIDMWYNSNDPLSFNNGTNVSHVINLYANNVLDNIAISKVEFEVSADPTFSSGVTTLTGATKDLTTDPSGKTWTRPFSTSIVGNGTFYARAKAYDGAYLYRVSTNFSYIIFNPEGTVPHGKYKEYSGSCNKCHLTHNGQNVYLSANISVNNLCTTCHNGSSAQKAHGFPSAYEHLWPEKNIFCSKCHNPHKTRSEAPTPLLRDVYNAGTLTGVPSDYQLCFNCHTSNPTPEYLPFQSQFHIEDFYKKASNSGKGTRGIDAGHYIKSPSGTYTFANGASVTQGYELRCTDCHDQHGSENKYLLKTYLGTNLAPVQLNDQSDPTHLTTVEERTFCQGCHNGNTNLYNNSDGNHIKWDEGLSTGHTDPSKKCTECHGGTDPDPVKRAMQGAHAPDNESPGNKDCTLCHEPITHNMRIDEYTGSNSHHTINPAFFNFPDANKYNNRQSCLQCHVDHDIFRPDNGAKRNRAGNLRQYFGDNPAAYTWSGSSVSADTDFIGSTTAPWYDIPYTQQKGGICISCHYQQQTRGYGASTKVRAFSSLGTAREAAKLFDTSVHNYTVNSTFLSDGSTFRANCSKCHNDTLPKSITWQNPNGNQFSAHQSDFSSLLNPFGDSSMTDPMNQNFCYKCHSNNAPASPTTDAYGLPMSGGKDIYTKFNSSGWSIHDINGTYTGSQLKCTNCHNTHAVSKIRDANKSDIVNPLNTLQPFTSSSSTGGGDIADFCSKCHGPTQPTATNTATVFIPFDVKFPTDATHIFTTVTNGWNKAMYFGNSATYKAGHYYPTRAGLTPADFAMCDNCHDPHGSPYRRLNIQDEDTTIQPTEKSGECLRCHSPAKDSVSGNPLETPAVDNSLLDVWTDEYNAIGTYNSKHPSLTVSGKHTDYEDYKNIALADRHAECTDCHDPHSARENPVADGTHDALSGVLFGVTGVTRDAGGILIWTNDVTQDWQVCYKCHSTYWNNLGAAQKRNIAGEFYRTGAHDSFHSVETNPDGTLKTSPDLNATNVNSHLTPGVLQHDGDVMTGTSQLYCTDCHGSDNSGSAKGPHGSNNINILKGRWVPQIPITTSMATLRSTYTDMICFRCHSKDWYANSTSHVRKSDHTVGCWRCHGERVHGTAGRSHLLRTQKTTGNTWDLDYEPYSYLAAGTKSYVTTGYFGSKGNCVTVGGSCH